MNDPAPPTVPPAFWPAGHNWASSLRWFFAEFVVVVAGILVALALSEWGADLRDREREQSYLRQLNVDLQASDAILAEAQSFLRARAEASARVMHRFWREDLKVDDSTRRDLGLPRTTRRFDPVLGTVGALISTGDLNLVRDDALRSQLVTYLDAMRTKLDDIRRYDETYYRPGVHTLNRGPDLFQFVEFINPDDSVRSVPNTIERVPFPSTLEAMFRDRDVFDGYSSLLIAHRNQSARYGEMLEQTRALRAQVEAAIEP